MDKTLDDSALEYKAVEWIVLSKAPLPGLVKTRLISTLGEQGACDLYRQLLNRLENTLKNLIADNIGQVALWVAGDAEHDAFHSWLGFATFYQQPSLADLGDRMAMAVQSSLSRDCIPILLGVDVPDLNETYLMNCLQQLENHELVISPAEDGGYGLLGMKQFYSELFTKKAWGTNKVFARTKSDIKNLKLNVSYLPQVWDVDEAEDVKRFKKLMNGL
ncbi:MAG: glycosyltransferase [Oleispira sp.]|nr:glycosyltransferase [Oleispira sp.]